jgi:hypothetical protein
MEPRPFPWLASVALVVADAIALELAELCSSPHALSTSTMMAARMETIGLGVELYIGFLGRA